MSKIELRGWDVSTAKMSYEVERHRYSNGWGFSMELDHFKDHWVNVEDEFVMLFSGLFDKNNNKIYEDDIFEDVQDDINVVKFNQGCFWIGNVRLFNRNKVGKVIGNIYKNPELLKKNGK